LRVLLWCQIVATLQRCGLCHGDLKPQNIVVDDRDVRLPLVSTIDVESMTPLPAKREESDLPWSRSVTELRRVVSAALTVVATGGPPDHGAIETPVPVSQAPQRSPKGGSPDTSAALAEALESPLLKVTGQAVSLRVWSARYTVRPETGPVLALNTTDWYAVGCTLSELFPNRQSMLKVCPIPIPSESLCWYLVQM
jgi:serine/threonine protein kinase